MSPIALRPLEVASGIVWGFDPALTALGAHGSRHPREVLEAIAVEALQHGPCVVSFSGGRDSSAVLAVAVDAARRHGLPLPVPVTLRVLDDPLADEDDWQTLVVRHLGLTDWVRLEIRDELGAIGPYAAPLLRRHGPLFPFNAHFHAPIAEQAIAGTVLTGFGGDEQFGRSRWRRVNQVRARAVRPQPRDVLRLAVAYGPRRIRARVLAREIPDPDWLTPAATREFRRELAASNAAFAIDWDRSTTDSWWRCRYRSVAEASLDLVGAMYRTRMRHPFTDPRFLVALAAVAGPVGYANRTEAMHALFADLLPHEVLGRRSKAAYQYAYWGCDAAAFAAQWDGRDVDPALADIEALGATWRERSPHPRTVLLLQQAWLAAQARASASGGSGAP